MGLNMSTRPESPKPRLLSVHKSFLQGMGPIRALDISSTNHLLAGSRGTLIDIWDCERLCILTQLSGHNEAVITIKFSKESIRIASCSMDGSIRIWGRSSGKWTCENVIRGNQDGWEWSCYWLLGGALASVGTHGVMNVWNSIHPCKTPELLGRIPAHTRSANCVSSVTISANIYLITAGNDSMITLSELSRSPMGYPEVSILRHIACALPGNIHDIETFEFNRNGECVFAAIGNDKSLRIWHISDVMDGKDHHVICWNKSYINCLRFSPDGRFLAIGDSAGSITIWTSPIRSLQISTRKVWSQKLRMGSIQSLVWTNIDRGALIVGLNAGHVAFVQLPSKFRSNSIFS